MNAKDTTDLVTAEAVAVDLRPARLGSRAVALMIDIAIQVVLCVILAIFLGILAPILPDHLLDDALMRAVITMLIVLVLLLYPTVVETMSNGRSVGKAAMGLRVVREDGGPIRLRHAFTRALIGFTVEWPGLLLPFLTWAGSLVTMIASDKGRRLGDLAAGTLVIHERRPVPFRFVPGTPLELVHWANAADLSAIDDDLAGAVGQHLSRVQELAEPYRSSLQMMLAAEVAVRISPPPPLGAPAYLVLAAVLAERRRRSTSQLMAGRMLTERLMPGFGRRGPVPLAVPLRPAAPQR